MNHVLRVIFLTVIWLALWSDLSAANVLSGLVVAVGVVLLFDRTPVQRIAFRPLRVLHFAGFFLIKLVQSTLVVARTVIAPRDRIRTGIIAVPLQGCSDTVATIIADSITLTPGTLSVDIDREPLVLYVHALDTRDVEQVRRDVRRMEVLAVRAFGDADALAGLANDDTRWSQS